MKITNLTPHAVNIVNENGELLRTIPSQGCARVNQTSRDVGLVDDIHTVAVEYGEITDLPAPLEGTYFIVSSLVVSAARACGRVTDDLLYPTDFVRDSEGKILGCKALARA